MKEVKALLEVRGLEVHYRTHRGVIRAVNGVSFSIDRGEILGLVGEAGSGKSTIIWAVLGLVPFPGSITSGEILFEKNNLVKLSDEEMRHIRGRDVSVIPQNARSYLNPLLPIGEQIAQAYLVHNRASAEDARHRALELLEMTAFPDPERQARAYPHELSGGMAQRALICTTLACSPKLILADEPSSGLDVTIQAQILNLLHTLAVRDRYSMLLVTRDLGIIARYCDRVGIIYGGQVVEMASVVDFFERPKHEYSKALLNAASHGHSQQRVDEKIRHIRS